MIEVAGLKRHLRGRLLLHEPLANYTWMKVGGPADFYIEPADRDDLVTIVSYLRQCGQQFVIIGRGSNLLVSDSGFRGAVLNLETGLSTVRREGPHVIADAGAWVTKFVDYCVQQGLAGVEMLAGIPGTIGGAVIMNAGAYGGEISDCMVDVDVIRDGGVRRIPKAEGGFAYRHSGFVNDIVLGARFQMKEGDKEALAQRRRELIMLRNERQPLAFPNFGSTFKNPEGLHVARLIEEAGLKGRMIGAAQVSEKHANFIVNRGGATAEDVLRLILFVRRTIYERTGIMLVPEVKLLGFPDGVLAQLDERNP